MSTSRLSTGRRVPALVLTGVLLLAACSDSNGSGTTTTAAPPTTAPSTETTGDSRPATFTFGYVRPAAGLLSQLATAQEAAIGLAIDDINAAGGVNGGPVQLVAVDESPEGDTAAAVTDLVGKGANMVLGPISSTGAKASLAALTTGKSVACSASATSPELTTLDTTNVLYRTAMPDSFTVGLVADAVSADATAAKLPEGQQYKVSIVARDDDYGQNVGNSIAAALEARDMVVQIVHYAPRQGIFTAEADAVKANGSGTTIMVSYGEGVRLVDTLITAGVPAASLIGLDGMFDPNLAQRASNTDPSRLDAVRVMGSTGDRAFLDRLAAVPDLPQLVYGAQAYDCAIAGALAAQAAGSSDPTGFVPLLAKVTNDGQSCSTVADCLSKLAAGDDIDYEGVSGGIRWDAAGDPAEARFTTASFTAGKMNEVSTDEINLDDVRQQEATAATIFNTRVQQVLAALGYYSGPIDGQLSDEMTASLIALQTDLGVPPTGVYDEATDTALRAKYGNITGALGDSVTGLQQLLTDLGFYSGPIDGKYSQAVVDAVKALQAQLGVPPTGIIDAATLKAAYDQGLQAGTPPPTTSTPPATTVAPTTAPVTTVAPPTTVLPPVDPSSPTVLGALKADARFSKFVTFLTNAGYTDDTNVLGPITVFAPTNDAIDAMPQADKDRLAGDPESLLAFHLVDAGITLSFLGTLTSVQTMYGVPLTVTKAGNDILVNGAKTLAPDIRASNGIIIPIDAVLIPPPAG